jgi:DNA-binding beta-propeller fold protein YncE
MHLATILQFRVPRHDAAHFWIGFLCLACLPIICGLNDSPVVDPFPPSLNAFSLDAVRILRDQADDGSPLWYVPTTAADAPPGHHLNLAEDYDLAGPRGIRLIRGSAWALIGDAGNRRIRLVDLGHTRAARTLLAYPQVVVPYAVTLHHRQRTMLVADIANGTLLSVDLFSTPPAAVAILASGLGQPTDIVPHPPSGTIIVADGLNHSLWTYQESTGRAALLCGANHPSPGHYADGTAAVARFWVPLGLAYDHDRDVVYVADFKNRVIREVDPYTGATTTRVGRHDWPAGIVDGDVSDPAAPALLTGPSNLQYVSGEGAVYFTDRNPAYNSGLLRVWDVARGTVRTVVGGEARGRADGWNATAGAAWGVDVGYDRSTATDLRANEARWLVWTEADTHAVRVARRAVLGNETFSTSALDATTVQCGAGLYYNTSKGEGTEEGQPRCAPCLNWKPDLVAYITQGEVDRNDSCTWECPRSMYVPFTCPPFTEQLRRQPQWRLRLGTDVTGELEVVVCGKGFQRLLLGLSSACVPCSAGFYCSGEGLGEGGNGRVECPRLETAVTGTPSSPYSSPSSPYSSSSPGNLQSSSQGQTSTSPHDCHFCLAGSFCPLSVLGNSSVKSCPAGSTSPPSKLPLLASPCSKFPMQSSSQQNCQPASDGDLPSPCTWGSTCSCHCVSMSRSPSTSLLSAPQDS